MLALTIFMTGLTTAKVKNSAAVQSTTILVLGDSLSAEYGIAAGTGWVALLNKRLATQKIAARLVNSSISGETTSGGANRLSVLLKQHRPNVLIIELGANDALRGLALESTKANLRKMVKLGQQNGAKVLLVGMQVPPNYGKSYTTEFSTLFNNIAQEYRVPLVPFLLEGVANRPDARDWFQSDGLHPYAKAHPIMLDNIWPKLKSLL